MLSAGMLSVVVTSSVVGTASGTAVRWDRRGRRVRGSGGPAADDARDKTVGMGDQCRVCPCVEPPSRQLQLRRASQSSSSAHSDLHTTVPPSYLGPHTVG